VLQNKELASISPCEGGASPSGQLAAITIDSGSSMSGSEHGGNNNPEPRVLSSPSRGIGARSASPAKRSAADMEDADHDDFMRAEPTVVPGSLAVAEEDRLTDFDQAEATMRDATPAQNCMDTQDTIPDSQETSAQGTMSTNTSATSLQSVEQLPPYREEEEEDEEEEDANWRKGLSSKSANKAPPIDVQVQQVLQLKESEPLDEGTRGYIVSGKWFRKVLSRTSDGMKNSTFTKEEREGPIGPVSNLDVVVEGGFNSELKDTSNNLFVPMKRGLVLGEDFEVLPEKAWGKVVEWYPPPSAERPVTRYAHNTADPPAQNIQYEMDPPLFRIRKVPQPKQENERPRSSHHALDGLKARVGLRERDQNTPDDAPLLVSSRSERAQDFLARAKEAAGISRMTKVKVFKMVSLHGTTAAAWNTQAHGVPSPPASRSTSPSKPDSIKLVMPLAEFNQKTQGMELEALDLKDETGNDKYNGNSTMHMHALFEDAMLVLEEVIGGPGGGEFQSDVRKNSKFFLKNLQPGSKASSTPASGRTSPIPGGVMTRGRARKDGRTRGTVGLTNLGNTCYMNSGLQCLRSIEELAIYFLSGKYKEEINSGNPLGHNGVMAKQFANLLSQIYGDSTGSSVTPQAFKKAVGNSQPMFSGYGQQDSQEFISFLVDALHEDLNRIIKKPYNENPDSDDKMIHDPQAIIKLGEVYRANHRARNDSIAMDLFSGFYKNTMECPVCDKVSITFDPYSLLTVQLPIENTFSHPITFVPFVGRPILHAIEIDKNATVKMLKEYIASKHPGVSADKLWMIEVYNHKIYKAFDNHQSMAEANIGSSDFIFVYELQHPPTNLPEPSKRSLYSFSSVKEQIPGMESPKADCFAVPVFSRQKNRYGAAWETIMHPLYITVTRDEAQDLQMIQKKVILAAAQQSSRPILTEFAEDRVAQRGRPTAIGDVDNSEDTTAEDIARISDGSVPSEDGYVDISVQSTENGDMAAQKDESSDQARLPGNQIPEHYFDPEYKLSEPLSQHLFTINFSKSASDGGLHCASMASFEERSVHPMLERVKQSERRGSIQSSGSSGSSVSTSSGEANGQDEESDADDDEKTDMDSPDLVIGAEDPLHLQTPTTPTAGSDEDLPDDPLQLSRGGRRKRHGKNRRGKGRKRNVTYGKKDRIRRSGPQQAQESGATMHFTKAQGSLLSKQKEDDDGYFIKLGEAIVLDWNSEALDALFGGDSNDNEEMRGFWMSTDNGRNLTVFHDAALEELKKKRADRKKNGISLDDCFVETGKREILSEDNAWFCNRCKDLRQAAKTLEIWTLPDILIVHIKRFGGNRNFRDKIDVFVDYPIEGLDMTKKIGLKEDGKEYIYDLFAVDNHYGGLGGGHYTALAKNFYDGQWYDYNGRSRKRLHYNMYCSIY